MKLTNPTDDELNAAFAEHVAAMSKADVEYHTAPWSMKPRFTHSANAVLPWLEKEGWSWERSSYAPEITGEAVHFEVRVSGPNENQSGYCRCVFSPDQFARAAVVALLRAYGVEVEFT